MDDSDANRSDAYITVLCNLSSITRVPLTYCTSASVILYMVFNIVHMYIQDISLLSTFLSNYLANSHVFFLKNKELKQGRTINRNVI